MENFSSSELEAALDDAIKDISYILDKQFPEMERFVIRLKNLDHVIDCEINGIKESSDERIS